MAADHSHSKEIPTESGPPAGGAGDSSTGSAGETASAAATSSRETSAPAPLKPAVNPVTSVSDRVAASTRDTVRSLKLSSVGLELALSVLIGLFAGRWLDRKLGSDPWLMILGICLGFAAGLRSLMKMMDKAAKAADAADKADRDSSKSGGAS